MYSIPETLDATEFSGWINQDLLLKDSRRSTNNRKRSYDVITNVDINDQCDDVHRRVLRPRHNAEPLSSPGASRTRPIRSNRARRRPSDYGDGLVTTEVPSPPHATTEASGTEPQSSAHTSANELSFIQALASYNWLPQNYLVAHTDPSLRLELPSYSHLNSSSLGGARLPHFDPWVLHGYLLASSGYPSVGGGHSSQDNSHENHNLNLPPLGYHSMASETAMNPNMIWQYPFLLNTLQSQVARPAELVTNSSHHTVDPNSDLSYFYRSSIVPQRDANSNRTDTSLRNDRIHSTNPFNNDNPMSSYSNHMLPHPFSYPFLCPYHNTSHILHSNQQGGSHPLANTSSNISEPQHQPSFGNFQNHTELSFNHYWHQLAPVIRPVNYSMNSSNIDTLLHLAAHFEQRKRGISREELDKLPTHRHKVSSERGKRAKISTDDRLKVTDVNDDQSQKCLVCLEDFESKQSIRTLRCSHEFHAKCIDKWLKINRTCPLCRADSFDGSAQKDGS